MCWALCHFAVAIHLKCALTHCARYVAQAVARRPKDWACTDNGSFHVGQPMDSRGPASHIRQPMISLKTIDLHKSNQPV